MRIIIKTNSSSKNFKKCYTRCLGENSQINIFKKLSCNFSPEHISYITIHTICILPQNGLKQGAQRDGERDPNVDEDKVESQQPTQLQGLNRTDV